MMRPLSLTEIAASLGSAAAGDLVFTGLGTDSRTVGAGELFVALRGERFDAHDFIPQALARGAAALVCDRPIEAPVPVIVVGDTLRALGAIARLHRNLYSGHVVALTGSAGKTTTKDMIAAILAKAGTVHATRGNLNNEIGVPLTLLGLHPGVDYAVVEMGAAHPGDIAYLAALASPGIALVTNALPAHLEGLGTLEEVARTKGAIYESLPADGVAVLNVDDVFAPFWAKRIGARRTVRVSAKGLESADVRARNIRMERGVASFLLCLPGEELQVTLQIPGVQQVANAVAAAGVALALGIPAELIRRGLESIVPGAGRMQPRVARGGAVLLDDTYNANPGSVRAAIDTLALMQGTRVLVLGNMAELGTGAEALHADAGRYSRERGIDQVLATGVHAAAVASAFGTGGRAFADRDALAAACVEIDAPGVVILVKGSRSAGMEFVVAALTEAGLAPVEAH